MTKATGTAQVPGTVTLDRETTHRIPIAGAAVVTENAQTLIRVGLTAGVPAGDIAALLGMTPDEVVTIGNPFPPCPDWCPGGHMGGQTEVLGNGVVITADLLHEKILTEFVTADGDSYADHDKVNVKAFIERYDTVDPNEPPAVTRVLVDIDQRKNRRFMRVSMTATELRALSAAALEGADLLDTAKAAEGR